MKAGKQTNQRKGSGSVIAPGTQRSNKWTSYLRALNRAQGSNRKVRPVGKGARGRRF